PVHRREDVASAYDRCASEAHQAFGDGRLYVEQLVPRARHVEVQILADRTGETIHLWDRECSAQRQRQKLIETAPAHGLPPALRKRLQSAAITLVKSADYRNLCTVEFLVSGSGESFAFIEANPRLQVEHTVTEEVTGLDLVRLQLEIAAGKTLL